MNIRPAETLPSGPARVLETLAAAARPLTLAELRARTGLHESTLRGHLDTLLATDRVTRMARHRAGPGRPAWAYAAREDEYAALSLALAAAISAVDGGVIAGGRDWGRRLLAQLGDPGGEPAQRLMLALEHTGFAPEREGDTIRLHRCPLLDAARQHPDVVCDVHRGLIEGVTGDSGTRLVPFADPASCHVRLP